GNVVRSGASGARNDESVFFVLRWAWCGSHKKRAGTRYVKVVFLHPLRSPCHVVRSAASGARKDDALFFMLRWARCGSHKKRAGTPYIKVVFLHPLRSPGN